MCSCQQKNHDSLMDGPSTTGYRSTLADTTPGQAAPGTWAIDGKAPWSTAERLLGAVGAGLIVGTIVSAVVIKGKKK